MRKIATAGLAVIMVAGFTACSQNRTGSTEWGCLYGGGAFEKRNLKAVVPPGSSGGWTSMDDLNTIPADVRSYTLDLDPAKADAGATPIELPASARDIVVDGEAVNSEGITTVSIDLQVRFMFNENVCVWYEKVGKTAEPLNFNAPEGEVTNWTKILNSSFQRRIREAMRPIIQRYDWLVLSTNQSVSVDGKEVNVFTILNEEISKALSEELAKDLGGTFFCGPTYTFDGDVDGTFECPPFEVNIDEIRPKDPSLIENYNAIVANAEAQLKIASDRDLAINRANAAAEQQQAESRALSETEIVQAQTQRETQVAQADNQRAVNEANAARDLAKAQADQAIAEAELIVKEARARAEAAFCIQLASVGVNCALYQHGYPNVLVGEGAETEVLVQP